MQIQILVFLENLIPVQRVLLGQRSAFFFHSHIYSQQPVRQSVSHPKQHIKWHCAAAHQPHPQIPRAHYKYSFDPEMRRTRRVGGKQIVNEKTLHCRFCGDGTQCLCANECILPLSLSLWDLPTNNPPPSLQRSLWCDRVQRIMMPMIMWNFWHYILTSASTAVTQRMNHPRLLHSLWDAGSWVGTTYSS